MDIAPVAWDELTGEPLREAVINVHNIIFGQLGTIGSPLSFRPPLFTRPTDQPTVARRRDHA